MSRQFFSALALAAACMPSLTQAAVVHTDYTLIGGNTWYADITVRNDGQPAQISGFTVYFSETAFANLTLEASPASWDTLLIAPDLGLPAAGFLDSFAIDSADALDPGEVVAGFRVRFDSLVGVPGAVSFDIVDSAYNVLFSAQSAVTAVPEPASALLALLGLGIAAGARRRSDKPSRAHNEEICA